MKDEITHKQDYNIFENRYEINRQIREDNETYKTLIREDLKTNFVAIPESVIHKIGVGNQYYTKDQILIDLQQQYVSLLKDYDKLKNRTLIQRIFNWF
tara:strand:- start:74 stop:367 length:294 start_codon:yes stop_codon:yes gene_type:complete